MKEKFIKFLQSRGVFYEYLGNTKKNFEDINLFFRITLPERYLYGAFIFKDDKWFDLDLEWQSILTVENAKELLEVK